VKELRYKSPRECASRAPKLIAERGSPTGLRHSAQAQIDAVGKNRGQQCCSVLCRMVIALMGEALRKAGPMINLEQKVGDFDAR
jgi:hypothetical protein